MWPSGEKPDLKDPKIIKTERGFKIISNNENSSLGWRDSPNENWQVYLKEEIIYPKNNFEIIEFSPGYGSKKSLFKI